MFYWRKRSFERLDTLYSEIKEDPLLKEYANYLIYLSKGLRDKALKHVWKFIDTFETLQVGQQREIASFLCRIANANQFGHRFVPQPIQKIIQPVLQEWIKDEPGNPEPYRWTGDSGDLRKSLHLDPNCDDTRLRYVHQLLSKVSENHHDFNNVKKDLKLLNTAELEVNKIKAKLKREGLYQIIQEERREIKSQMKQ